MQPLVTPEQMRQIDAALDEPLDEVIDRVGHLIALAAIEMMGGAYGRRVVVVAGPGNNGADGRAAAKHLDRRGVAVTTIAPGIPIEIGTSRGLDLVIDAAFGTGIGREYQAAPMPSGVRVLAVDIPSGYSGADGAAIGSPRRADRTLVLAGYKVGQLFEPARSASGELRLVDIGVPIEGVDPVAYLLEPNDVAGWLPDRPTSAHKWHSACWVIGGAPGMRGAAQLAAVGAARAGAGYVRLSTLGDEPTSTGLPEIVSSPIGGDLSTPDLERFASLVVGPGLGRSASLTKPLIDLVRRSPQPLVLDADALWHLGEHLRSGGSGVFAERSGPVVLTPHDGEFARLTGAPPGADRVASASNLADQLGVTVLLKGPTTVIAAPGGPVYVSTAGDQRLATAGSGDVLAGLIGSLAAQGLDLPQAAGCGAFLHGHAATLTPALIAGDLPQLVTQAIVDLRALS